MTADEWEGLKKGDRITSPFHGRIMTIDKVTITKRRGVADVTITCSYTVEGVELSSAQARYYKAVKQSEETLNGKQTTIANG